MIDTLKKLTLLVGLLAFCFCACSRPFQSEKNADAVHDIIKSDYIKSIPDQTLDNNAIKGMMENLDPNSTYLDEKSYLYLKQLTEGKYSGIGIEVKEINSPKHGLEVVAFQDESPAEAAGIKVNDIIINANEQSFEKLTSTQMIQRLRGPNNSQVLLKVFRPSENKTIEMNIKRTTLNTTSVKTKLLTYSGLHIGYIHIAFFEKNSDQLVKNAINSLQQQTKLSGLILDLRNNPGGLLESAAKVSDLFLDYQNMGANHLLVLHKSRRGETAYSANPHDKDIFNHLPIVILINQGTASSAEIVSAALHDHQRAVLVGTKTYGKGSVQSVIPLGENQGALKLTTGYYYTPNGKLIDKIGIFPDITVTDPKAQLERAEEEVVGNTRRKSD